MEDNPNELFFLSGNTIHIPTQAAFTSQLFVISTLMILGHNSEPVLLLLPICLCCMGCTEAQR